MDVGQPSPGRLPGAVARGPPGAAGQRMGAVARARLHRERERAARHHRACGRGRPRERPPPSATASGWRGATPRCGWVGCWRPTRCATWWWSTRSAPRSPGCRPRSRTRRPPICVGALAAQIDLRQIISQGGFDVFVDPTALPLRATCASATAGAVGRRRPGRRSRASTAVASVTGMAGPAAASGALSRRDESVTGRVRGGNGPRRGGARGSSWQLTGPDGATVVRSRPRSATRPRSPWIAPGTVTVGVRGVVGPRRRDRHRDGRLDRAWRPRWRGGAGGSTGGGGRSVEAGPAGTAGPGGERAGGDRPERPSAEHGGACAGGPCPRW